MDEKGMDHGFFLDILEELGSEVEDLLEENIETIRNKIRTVFSKELDFLWNLPTVLIIGNYIFAHAGIPTEDIDELKNSDAAQCMNPIFDYHKHIIAIDGGCGLKHDAQLNALIIPSPEVGMSEVSFVTYDNYPVLIALSSQNAKEKTMLIRYFDSEVEMLEDRGDIVFLRHISSNIKFLAPKYFVYYKGPRAYCYDYSDAYLEVKRGDELSVIAETAIGYVAKKDGVIGWYMK